MDQKTQYRVACFTPTAEGPPWSAPLLRPPLAVRAEPAAVRDTPENDRQQMDCFGISARQKTVYEYKGYVYDRLADALNYARTETTRAAEAVSKLARQAQGKDTGNHKPNQALPTASEFLGSRVSPQHEPGR